MQELCVSLFFFQAEDGIRDHCVTGVQTCALPICLLGAMTSKERVKYGEKGISTITQLSYGYRPRRRRRIKPTAPHGSPPVRSEERRVGKECRSGRSPYP